MKKCCKECRPCCDYCIHSYHEYIEDPDGGMNGYCRGEPSGCIIHYDAKHQEIAKHFGNCDDFYCFRQYQKDTTGWYP